MIRTGNPTLQAIRGAAARAVMAAVLFGAQALASPAAAAGGPHPLSSDRMLSHMTSQLNLTDAQAQQIKQVLDSRHAQMAAQFEALRSAREALRQATLATPFNEGAIRGAAQAIGQAEGDAAVLRAQVHAQILPLLNADQQQKFATFGEGRHSGWKSHTSDPAD